MPPPSVPTPKLNLTVALSLPDSVRDKEVSMLVDAACTARLNGDPKLCICCENVADCKKGFRAGKVSTGSVLEDNESMTHKSNKAHTHNNKQVKRERPFILPKKVQPLTPG